MVKRNIGVDILRSISMIMVIIMHIVGKGELLIKDYYSCITVNQIVAYFWFIMSAVGVNCFALISGYVGFKRKVKINRLLSIWSIVMFYSVLISFIGYLCKINSAADMIKALFPMLTDRYWYFTAYVMVFLLSPILNFIIDCLPKEKSRNMIIILTGAAVLDCVIGNNLFDFQVGYCFTWLSVLYSIGAYINKYQIDSLSSMLPANRCGKGYLMASIGGFTVSIIIEFILYNFTGKIRGERFFNQYTSPIVVFASIMLFLFFVNLKIQDDILLVNLAGKIRKNVFSVFILHNHPTIIDLFMTKFEMFNLILPILEFFFIPVAAIIVFTVCIVIDRIRENIFNALHMQNLISWIGKKIKLDGVLEI